jgi:HEAT repeat protein
MKQFCVFLICAGALAAAATGTADTSDDDRVVRMLDDKLTAAQRNDACFALRGNRSPEVVSAMRAALASQPVRACASRNLRAAEAIDEFRGALGAPQPEVRAEAARQLGSFERPEFIELLAKTAHDPNMLVAINAVMGLGEYRDRAALPYLLDLARGGGVVGVAALSRAARFNDPATLPIARNLLSTNDAPAKLLALKIVGDLGDAADLPRLREMAAKSQPVSAGARGFGLMPVVDLARVAKSAIAEIEKRTGHQEPKEK